MSDLDYQYTAFPLEQICDSYTIEFFKTLWEAKEYYYEMATDADNYTTQSINYMISDLSTVIRSGIDIYSRETLDLTSFAQLEMEKK